MAVTIYDVAERARVSPGTVSRYLNGHRLREQNRLQVEQAIEELDFKENIIAKGLKGNRSMTIAVMIPHYSAPFFMAVTAILEQVLEQENYSLVLHNFHHDPQRLQERLRFAKNRSVDGLVLFPSYSEDESIEILQEYLDENIPIVIVEQSIPEIETDVVKIDNAHAAFRAVEKLILANHRRIALVNSSENIYMFQERRKGYYDAMQTYNLPVEEEWLTAGDFIRAGECTVIRDIFETSDPPTAVFTTNYHATIGTVMALHQLHLRIPEDVSIVGFDHFDPVDAIEPLLTLVVQPIERIGQVAAELLLKRIQKDYAEFPQTVTLNTKMLIRDSVETLEKDKP